MQFVLCVQTSLGVHPQQQKPFIPRTGDATHFPDSSNLCDPKGQPRLDRSVRYLQK